MKLHTFFDRFLVFVIVAGIMATPAVAYAATTTANQAITAGGLSLTVPTTVNFTSQSVPVTSTAYAYQWTTPAEDICGIDLRGGSLGFDVSLTITDWTGPQTIALEDTRFKSDTIYSPISSTLTGVTADQSAYVSLSDGVTNNGISDAIDIIDGSAISRAPGKWCLNNTYTELTVPAFAGVGTYSSTFTTTIVTK